ncbi:alpha/beta hydrolase [Couchioplanes caeruleus]|uniref:alpha/beta hydrolase n=1 Tax=Couchioplanes caeruleus TaxID=56438 RepID=UPI0020BF5D4E|nr:alpha/beta hydrolase [Couchioplanes caeruleus]UQU63605.1 alpha/beta hydrolase [Couchioplanes caeruleus]
MSQPDEIADARLLIEAIARLWPRVPQLLGDEQERFESELLIRLRALDAALDTAGSVPATGVEGRVGQAQRGVLGVFEAFPAAYRELAGVFADVERGAVPRAIPGAVAHERYLQVPVFYATDRATVDDPRPSDWFSGRRGELSYGVAQVSIPDDHRMAALEKPRWWRLDFVQDPARHVAVLDVAPLGHAEFVDRAAGTVAGATVPEALVFVHGYNVSFTDAARRAAQVAYDLHFPGLPMLYSWPSESAALRYTTDENNAVWTRPHFATFLRLALTGIGARRVHALAHSMGNRVLTDGLAGLPAEQARTLGQVVFAAPDIDAAVFTQLAAVFAGRAAGYTLYASSNDKALQASQKLARYPRAGQTGDGLVVVTGVETIDASQLDTGLMSHSYFGERTSVLSDLFYLLRDATPAAGRFGLTLATHTNGLPYWVFDPRAA